MAEVGKKIFCFWTGSNEMPPARKECLSSMKKNLGIHVECLYWRDWFQKILPQYPLHEGFKYLSCIHKSDYLRCYFMHHYGGGYADIKYYTRINNWNLCFEILQNFPQIQVIGEPEIIGGSPIKEYNEPDTIRHLLVNCYFICRPQSEFTKSWYAKLLSKMDHFLPALKKNPAQDPFGTRGGYPVPWAALMGEIFHTTILEFRNHNPEAICSGLLSGRDKHHDWR